MYGNFHGNIITKMNHDWIMTRMEVFITRFKVLLQIMSGLEREQKWSRHILRYSSKSGLD